MRLSRRRIRAAGMVMFAAMFLYRVMATVLSLWQASTSSDLHSLCEVDTEIVLALMIAKAPTAAVPAQNIGRQVTRSRSRSRSAYPGQANVPEPAQGRLQVRAHLLQQFHRALPHNVEDKWTRSCSKPVIQSQSQPASICSSASAAGRCCRCTQTAVASLAASPCRSCGTRHVNKEAACCSRSSARIRSSSSDFLT